MPYVVLAAHCKPLARKPGLPQHIVVKHLKPAVFVTRHGYEPPRLLSVDETHHIFVSDLDCARLVCSLPAQVTHRVAKAPALILRALRAADVKNLPD